MFPFSFISFTWFVQNFMSGTVSPSWRGEKIKFNKTKMDSITNLFEKHFKGVIHFNLIIIEYYFNTFPRNWLKVEIWETVSLCERETILVLLLFLVFVLFIGTTSDIFVTRRQNVAISEIKCRLPFQIYIYVTNFFLSSCLKFNELKNTKCI